MSRKCLEKGLDLELETWTELPEAGPPPKLASGGLTFRVRPTSVPSPLRKHCHRPESQYPKQAMKQAIMYISLVPIIPFPVMTLITFYI